jgi:hypothetical protein
MATVMRLAPKLPAYGGALAVAIGQGERAESVPAQAAYHPPAAAPTDGDTPDHEVAQMRQRAVLAQFQAMGVNVTKMEQVSDDELIRRGREGGVVDAG